MALASKGKGRERENPEGSGGFCFEEGAGLGSVLPDLHRGQAALWVLSHLSCTCLGSVSPVLHRGQVALWVLSHLICTEDRLLFGDVQLAVLSVMFNIAVSTELQFVEDVTCHVPTEVFWGDRACSRYQELLLWFLSSFMVTGTKGWDKMRFLPCKDPEPLGFPGFAHPDTACVSAQPCPSTGGRKPFICPQNRKKKPFIHAQNRRKETLLSVPRTGGKNPFICS